MNRLAASDHGSSLTVGSSKAGISGSSSSPVAMFPHARYAEEEETRGLISKGYVQNVQGANAPLPL